MKESVLELPKKELLVMKSSLTVKMKVMAGEMFDLIVQKRNTRVMILKCLRKKQILNVSFFYDVCTTYYKFEVGIIGRAVESKVDNFINYANFLCYL